MGYQILRMNKGLLTTGTRKSVQGLRRELSPTQPQNKRHIAKIVPHRLTPCYVDVRGGEVLYGVFQVLTLGDGHPLSGLWLWGHRVDLKKRKNLYSMKPLLVNSCLIDINGRNFNEIIYFFECRIFFYRNMLSRRSLG